MITVKNEAAREIPPYQFTIQERRVSPGEPTIITLPYNPEGWERTYEAQWEPRRAAGAQYDNSEWSGNPPSTMGTSITLQEDDGPRLEETLLALERMIHRVDNLSNEPPLVLVGFGRHVYHMCMTRLSVNRLDTDPRGNATRAEVRLEFMENRKSPGAS